MLHRDYDFAEWQLAKAAKEYIPVYLKREEDKICYVPYKDVPSDLVKYVKFVFEEAVGWMYVDNNQFEK
jgi:hypothetical protein